MARSVLRAENLYKSYHQGDQEIPVLRGISLSFDGGATYAITGISGSGKSTLLHLLAGLDMPTKGTVYYDEQNIVHFTAQERALFLTKKIGLVFQQPYLIREMSVLENVMIKGLLFQESYEEAKEKASMLLREVGLREKMAQFPGQLSGGQQQRVAIARALMNKPHFLLADEPTGSLDVQTGQEIMDLLMHLHEHWGMGLLVSSHEPYVYQRMKHVLELKAGTF